ncbi:carbohydrate ABC transporter permease [Alicyclobacillus tolerans]|uniref:Multiple sugar transport system permease protein n=2 Tax=Alicyclobacillus tolerans TaxID=90970 RepID=A0ABT9LUJ2_9BACL|nr:MULTISPECIES: carbohydrate ABC transporter permease [Alicyclobacillus]MDP9727929.1 multiple sugar transport system permease protein [Alicyclobacillus tengchongensis]QRF24228.1 carbohydrate ABC transporter permease [Alicyclobacillus sp. TC]SHK62304.1 carbohydrate ABC transporter membrane protein 2, CUT1 family [Alicyclobacillus montanus]
MSHARSAWWVNALIYAVLCVGACISIFPYLISILTSLKPANEVYAGHLFPSHVDFKNYLEVWTSVPFGRYLLNTLFVSVVIVLGQLIFGSLAAYAFARMRFMGRNVLFMIYLSTLMVPNIVTLIPLFILMKDLGWINSYAALIAPTVLSTPVGIFLLRQFFLGIPGDIEEAARIDGAGVVRIFLQIILPLSRPILATLAIITFVTSWNNFLWPLIVTNTDQYKVVSLGIASFQLQYGAEWNELMAAATIALLPLIILFILFQKQIIRSIQLTGLK